MLRTEFVVIGRSRSVICPSLSSSFLYNQTIQTVHCLTDNIVQTQSTKLQRVAIALTNTSTNSKIQFLKPEYKNVKHKKSSWLVTTDRRCRRVPSCDVLPVQWRFVREKSAHRGHCGRRSSRLSHGTDSHDWVIVPPPYSVWTCSQHNKPHADATIRQSTLPHRIREQIGTPF